MVARHFQDQQQKELKAERDDALKMRRVASSMAKMVREFWANIEKVIYQFSHLYFFMSDGTGIQFKLILSECNS